MILSIKCEEVEGIEYLRIILRWDCCTGPSHAVSRWDFMGRARNALSDWSGLAELEGPACWNPGAAGKVARLENPRVILSVT